MVDILEYFFRLNLVLLLIINKQKIKLLIERILLPMPQLNAKHIKYQFHFLTILH